MSKKIASIVESLICELQSEYGFSFDDEIKDTPDRVARAWDEILSGYRYSPEALFTKRFPGEDYDQMIIVKDIKFYSTCVHHMMPFFGFASVGYLPNKEGRVIGLSKIPRLVQIFSRRLQIQERLTQQIATAIQESIDPRGVGVVIRDSIHLCAHMRGVKESHSTMVTSALYGEFREDASVRSEFLRMIGL